jgi:hypothetical protein
VSGWDATLGTGDLEVDIAAGEGAINGVDVSTASTQTVDFTGDPDPNDPRKAAISVDSGGNVVKTLGMPVPADPTNEVRFRTWDPQPPAESVPGVVVAEVWLAAGETVLESEDIRDRRVGNQAANDLSGFTLSPAGFTDETSNRSLVTEYQNNTGEAIQVKAQVQVDQDSSEFGVSFLQGPSSASDEVDIYSVGSFGEADINVEAERTVTVSSIVADGHYYQVNSTSRIDGSAGSETLISWFEQNLPVQ